MGRFGEFNDASSDSGGGGTGVAPTNNPTFTGTVTMPDGRTIDASGWSSLNSVGGITSGSGNIVASAGYIEGRTVQIPAATSLSANATTFDPLVNAARYNAASANRVLGFFNPPVDYLLQYVCNKAAGTIQLVATQNVSLSITGGGGGTYTVSITGYTTATFNYTDPASTLQTTLSDGTHGPAGTRVNDISTSLLTVYNIIVGGGTSQPLVSGNFSGLTGGATGSVSSAVTIDGVTSLTIPPHTSVWISNEGTNFYTIGNMSRGSRTEYSATATTPTPSTTVAFTPSANQDCELSFAVSTAATFTVTYGPSTGSENTILSSTALAVGTFFNKRIPAGWKVIITGTIADLENILAVTC